MLIISVLVVIVLAPFASEKPDGLERVAEDHKFSDNATHYLDKLYHLFNDYLVPGISNEKVSTILAGLIGVGIVLVFSYIIFKIFAKKGK